MSTSTSASLADTTENGAFSGPVDFSVFGSWSARFWSSPPFMTTRAAGCSMSI